MQLLCASLQVQQLLTDPITHEDQHGSTGERPLTFHHTGGGWRGGRRKETVTLYQPPRETKTAQYWVLATSDR